MPNYRRNYVAGGTFFFTVKTERNAPVFQDETSIRLLGTVFRKMQQRWPVKVDAIVSLPEHLHTIKDEEDFDRHFDYVHWNPVKHGLVNCPCEWPHSSFHRWVKKGIYSEKWGCGKTFPREEEIVVAGE